MRSLIQVYGPDHVLVGEVGLRNPTPDEIRDWPRGRPHSGRFTGDVTVPEGGYIVLVHDDVMRTVPSEVQFGINVYGDR